MDRITIFFNIMYIYFKQFNVNINNCNTKIVFMTFRCTLLPILVHSLNIVFLFQQKI